MATDLAMRILMTAQDDITPSVRSMASAFDSSIGSTAALDSSLASLSASTSTLVPVLIDVDGNIAAMNVAFTDSDAVIAEWGASLDAVSAATGGLDASLATTDASLAGLDASLTETNISFAATDKELASAAAGFGATAASADTASASTHGFGLALLALAAGAIMVGAKAVKMASDFQSGITTLATGAGELQSNLGIVSQGILKLSTDTATSTKQLTDGMYMIESAGFHGADGLNVLKAAAEGAKVGNADLGTVANATTTIMTDFSISADHSSVAVNTLIATVANGKTTLGALSGALSQILPTASAAKIGLNDTMAAMATMTGEGVPAANAATYLRQTIIALVAPSKQTASALQSVGLTTTQVSDEMKVSLPGALQMITDAVGKKFPVGSQAYIQAIQNIAGGSKQMQGILDLTGTHMSTFTSNVKNIAGAVQQGGNAITGWAAVQQDFNFKIDQAKAAVDAFMIALGTKLLPILSQIVGSVTPVIAAFTGLVSSGNQLSPLGQLFQALAMGWQAWASEMDTGEIIGGLQALATSAQSLFTNVFPYFSGMLTEISGDFQTFASYLAGLAVPALQLLKQGTDGLTPVLTALFSGVSRISNALSLLVAAVAPVVIAFVQWIADSGILPVIFNVLSVAIGIVVAVLVFLINVITAVVTWFSTTAVGIAAFRAILIILGVAIGIIAIIIFSVVIPAFIAWVAGAIAVGIANIIAFAPIILIILAIVVVVTIVVLVITHWGEIAHWLQGVWAAVVNWFKSAWGATGAWFQGLWSTVSKAVAGFFGGVGAFFVGLWNGIKNGATTAWNGLVNGIKGIVNGVVTWLKGIWQDAVNTVVGWFNWLYNHNYYFKDLVDEIIKQFTITKNFIIQVWNDIVTFFTGIWNRIVTNTEQGWKNISSTLTTWNNNINKFVQGIWNDVVTFITGIWNKIVTNTQTGWKNISNVVSGAWNNYIAGPLGALWNNVATWAVGIWNQVWRNTQQGWQNISNVVRGAWNTYIAGPLGSLWNQLSNWFGNLANQALKWGRNLIQSLIDGINGMLGNIGQAAQNVAKTIASFLGFHSPAKEGPGADLMTWGPGLVKGFSESMLSAKPILQSSLNLLMAPVAQTLSSAPPTSASPAGGGGSTQIGEIHVHLNSNTNDAKQQGQQVAQEVQKQLAKLVRGQAITPRLTSGGRH